MKLFIFGFTVFFMLTVTLQESLAQAATKVTDSKKEQQEVEEFIKKFTEDPENFYPQTGPKKIGLSETEADAENADPLVESPRYNARLDRHTNTNPKKAMANRKTVQDAMGGRGSESDR